MQGLDHVAELVEHAQRLRVGRFGGVPGVWREERHRRIAPVVGVARRRVLRVELEHGHQLHGGDAQVDQVGDLVDQAGIGAAPVLVHTRAGVAREAAHVRLVDDGLRKGAAQQAVALPVVGVVGGDHALHGPGVVAAGAARGAAAVVARHRDGAAVGVEQQLVAVEAVAAQRVEWAVHAPGVELAHREAGHEDVPVMPGAVAVGVERERARRRARIGVVEEQQLDAFGVARIDAEIHATALGLGARWVRAAGLYFVHASALHRLCLAAVNLAPACRA